MIKLGLIGKDISHSMSPQIYKNLISANFTYKLMDFAQEASLPTLQELAIDFYGINITSPYKKYYFKEVIPDDISQQLGIINCIQFRDGRFFGCNTDYWAIKEIYEEISSNIEYENIIILGSGAMADLFHLLFSNINCKYFQFSRKGHGPIESLDLRQYANSLVINCCSRSFHFYGQLSEKSMLWDLNYNMLEHRNWCKSLNIAYQDGQELLLKQALYALQFWGLN